MNGTFYFGYGSNLSLSQMDRRCPASRYVGVGRLSNYRWIINERGYANIVESTIATTETHAPDVVYGLIYLLTPEDEARLDVNEGVPDAYTKEMMTVEFWHRLFNKWAGGRLDVKKPAERRSVLVYIDRKRVGEGEPNKEYVWRMNRGIKDAVEKGVPRRYVERVMRRFVPVGEGEDDDVSSDEDEDEDEDDDDDDYDEGDDVDNDEEVKQTLKRLIAAIGDQHSE